MRSPPATTSAPIDRIEALLGARPRRLLPLSGGCIAPVHLCEMPDGSRLVAKRSRDGRSLEIEAWMLGHLRRHSLLPVPAVIAIERDLLLLEHVEGGDPIDREAQAHAAELLSALHAAPAPGFGFERDTVIGSLDQPNPRGPRWVPFFRDHRLLHRARSAHAAGRLPAPLLGRIEVLASRLERWLEEPPHPALIHGDAWGGNLLARRGRIVGFIDPALYWAHPEIELAFGTLFDTFGPAFFERYAAIGTLAPGFFEARRDLYNLYPLLVHVELFGGSYVAAVERTLAKFGV